MLYQTELTVPANTLITSPVETSIELIFGTVNQVEIMFPPGSAGLLKVAVFWKQFKLWPSTPERWFYADNYVFKWPEDFRVIEHPFSLRLVGYNEDTVYPHTVILRIAMLSGTNTLTDYLNQILRPQIQLTE